MSSKGSQPSMDPSRPGLKAVFWTGVVAVSPLLVMVYVLIQALRAVGAAISPLAERLGVMRLIGEIGLFSLMVAALLLLFLLGGWFVLRNGQGRLMTAAERLALKVVPGLAELKKRKEQIVAHSHVLPNRIPGLIGIHNQWRPGWRVADNDTWVVVAFPTASEVDPYSIEVHPKEAVQFKPVENKAFEAALEGLGDAWLRWM